MYKKYDITAIIEDKRGMVLSIGKNNYTKTHTLQYMYAKRVGLPHKCFLHAEINAIIRCKDISKAHKISVFRFGKDGRPLMAKPCKICESAIVASNIKIVEYTKGE